MPPTSKNRVTERLNHLSTLRNDFKQVNTLYTDVIKTLNCRKQGNKLRRLMTFAWPCLLTKNCVNPLTKYPGHLLLSHIIAKFAIHKRIVLQVILITCASYELF